MPFMEIAFQAEISRFWDDEFEEFARRNCNEDPATRDKKIQELRNMIKERGECVPRRMDDAYLLRFLRCRSFIPALAHKLVVRYEEFRKNNPHLYQGIECFKLSRVKEVYGGAFPESPRNGRVTLMRFGRWDVNAVPIEDVVRCALLMDELAALQPRCQIMGITVIVDLEGLSYRHVRQLTPTVASNIVSLMGINFPINMNAIHFVNYSWILNTFFYIFKQFIPSGAWHRLHFHGYDMSSLHKHIDPDFLPPEYGGSPNVHVIATEEWIEKINYYKDDFLVHELVDLGFSVEDIEDRFFNINIVEPNHIIKIDINKRMTLA